MSNNTAEKQKTVHKLLHRAGLGHAHKECNSCCGEHCHHGKGGADNDFSLILMGVSIILLFISFIPKHEAVSLVFQIIAVILAIFPIMTDVIKGFKNFEISEIELMFIAIVAACCLGEFREAAAVGIFYRIGEILEDKAIERSRKNIDAVSKIQQDFANIILPDGTTEKVSAESVNIGSKIRVLPFERFPIDGEIYEGVSTADASAITGESMPVDIERGTQIKSGMINGKGTVSMITTKEFGESTASRIVKMVEDAADRKGKTQKIITRVAKIYTPVIVALAVIIAVIPSIITKNPLDWIHRALVFLVASCPCALVLSIPLGYYSGLGAAAKKGVIVKGTAFAEIFAKAHAIVFDKTGTITTGSFEIEEIHPADGFSEDMVITLAAAAEHFSSHPIAKSIAAFGPALNEALLTDFTELPGNGASVRLAGKKIICGSRQMLRREGIDVSGLPDGEICVALEKKVIGTIVMRSRIRKGAAKMIDDLKTQGIQGAVMLTGDNEIAARTAAEECDIDEYYCDLLPEDKLKKLEQIKRHYGNVVYVGDGINDAPVLAAADAGIAMGLGTQAANEAADIILTNDDLSRLAPAHKIFRQTVGIMKFNIIFTVAVKLLVLLLGICGAAPIWLAVFADVGVCLICVFAASLIGTEIFNRIAIKK